MLKLGVLVSGSGTTLQAIINSIEEGYLKAEIVSVVSNNSGAYALERADKYNIPSAVIEPKSFSKHEELGQALCDHFEKYDVGLIVAAGYLAMIPENFIKKYKYRIMNIHPSLIPAFCGKGFYGLKVHEEALKRGVKVTGATVHFVDEVYDNGPIIIQKAVSVLDTDTAKSLQLRVMQEAEWIIYPEAIKLFSENRLNVIDHKVILTNEPAGEKQ